MDPACALAPLVVPVLAMVGAMALLCFVKVFGAVYLGQPRSEHALRATESEPAMRLAMGVLVACCAGIGLLPGAVAPLLDAAIACVASRDAQLPALGTLAPLSSLSVLGFAMLATALLVGAWLWRRRPRGAPSVGTWDCGYAQPTASMQYTASSFAQGLVALLRWLLMPRTSVTASEGLFPKTASARFHSDVPDVVLDRALLPVLRGLERACVWLKQLQGGRSHLYLLYGLLTLLVLLLMR